MKFPLRAQRGLSMTIHWREKEREIKSERKKTVKAEKGLKVSHRYWPASLFGNLRLWCKYIFVLLGT